MFGRGALDWTTEAQKHTLLSCPQGSLSDGLFSSDSKNGTTSSDNPVDIVVSHPEPFNLFQEIGYSQEALRLSGGVFDTSFELISPKSSVSFKLIDRREEQQHELCNKLIDIPVFDPSSSATETQKHELGIGQSAIQHDECLRKIEAVDNYAIGIGLQSETGDYSASSSAALDYSGIQLSGNFGADVSKFCDEFWDKSLSTLMDSMSENSLKTTQIPIGNSFAATVSISPKIETHCKIDNDQPKADGCKQAQLKTHGQSAIITPQLGKRTFQALSIASSKERFKKPMNPIRDSSSACVSDAFTPDLPRISSPRTHDSWLQLEARVPMAKRKFSEDDQKVTFISCRMKKVRNVGLKNPHGYPLRPMLIPSVPVIPIMSALKPNYATFDHRPKNSIIRKVKC